MHGLRTATCLGAVWTALVISACGSGGSSTERTGKTPTDRDPLAAAGLAEESIDKLSLEQIERFARLQVPASGRDLRSHYLRGPDTLVEASFTIDRSDLDAFLRDARLRATPEPGWLAIPGSAGRQLGWRLTELKRFKGVVEPAGGGVVRQLVIDLAAADRATVYLRVFTT